MNAAIPSSQPRSGIGWMVPCVVSAGVAVSQFQVNMACMAAQSSMLLPLLVSLALSSRLISFNKITPTRSYKVTVLFAGSFLFLGDFFIILFVEITLHYWWLLVFIRGVHEGLNLEGCSGISKQTKQGYGLSNVGGRHVSNVFVSSSSQA